MSIYKEWTLPEMRKELNRIGTEFWNLQQDLYALSFELTQKEFEAKQNNKHKNKQRYFPNKGEKRQ